MKVFIRRIYFLGLLFVLLGSLNAVIGLRQFNLELRNEIERSVAFKLDHIMNEITSELVDVEQILRAAEIYMGLEEDEEKVLQFFIKTLENNDSFLSIYFGTPENKMINGSGWMPSDDFDLRLRPWYQLASSYGTLIHTEPYLNASEDHWVITIAKPVYGVDQELLGVLAIDKSLRGMLEFLDLAKASEKGYSFILDKSGMMINNPQEVPESSPLLLLDSAVEERILGEKEGLILTNIQGTNGYLQWRTLHGSRLVLGTFAPFNDFFDRWSISLRMIGIAFLSILIAFCALFFIQQRYLIDPMWEFDQDIMGISIEDDVKYRLPLRKNSPFELLRNTLNMILDNTQEHCENVIHQQEALAAAYGQLVAHEEQLQSQYTQIKQNEDEIQFLAEHDSLTGLYNRWKFTEDLKKSIELGQSGTVFMLDIDNFKHINDTQGHFYGDRVLQCIAKHLKDRIPSCATAYRFGGDEFLVIYEGETSPGVIRDNVETITRLFNELNMTDDRYIHITSSIGIVRYPSDGMSVEELLIKADIAMYNAKKAGRNGHLFFEGSMASLFAERVQVERILVEAIQTEGFTLLYQPIVETNTGQIAYFEALIRLQNYSIPPSIFITIAEESTLILPIGRWVIRSAIKQILEWKQLGKSVKPISVNLSPRQFYDDGLVEFLRAELGEHAIEPQLMEIEITESVLIDNVPEAITIIERIKAIGIKIALDDFGTGYSSINYITRIPVDRIKIDRSLTQTLIENLQVMEGLIEIAHGLNMDVVAEGVERFEEINLLKHVQCDYLQGYLFSRPVSGEHAEVMLELDYSNILNS